MERHGLIVGKTGVFSLGKATDQEEVGGQQFSSSYISSKISFHIFETSPEGS